MRASVGGVVLVALFVAIGAAGLWAADQTYAKVAEIQIEGAGAWDYLTMDSPAKLTVVDTITTTRGARTMAVDPATHRVYTATQDFGPADPNAPPPPPGSRGGPPPVPNTFRVLVFAPK
jgi:hypothetical protein